MGNMKVNRPGKERSGTMAKNPYVVLGVSETATDAEIRNAYRNLAKKYHPDLNPNDPEAARRMNEVNVAYDQIKTADKRAEYRASQSQRYEQQSAYTYNPWQTYYRTGQGYYGGSYTGDDNRNNEPPFGWGSVFEENRRRSTPTVRLRFVRVIYLILAFLLLSSLARCVLYSCLFAPMSGCANGYYDRTNSDDSLETESIEIRTEMK